MRVSLVGSHMVSAWAREEGVDWRGFAAIEPPLCPRRQAHLSGNRYVLRVFTVTSKMQRTRPSQSR